jgi:signal transduction histidine kinase
MVFGYHSGMGAMEAAILGDRMASALRWAVLVVLALVLASGGRFDGLAVLSFTAALAWALLLTGLNLFSQRLPAHPWSMIAGDAALALGLFFLAGSNSLGWAALLPAFSAAVFYGAAGGLLGAAIPLAAMAAGLVSLTSVGVALQALALPAVVAPVLGAAAGYGVRPLARLLRQGGPESAGRAQRPGGKASTQSLYQVLATMNSTLEYQRVLDLALDVSATALSDPEHTSGFLVSAFYLLDGEALKLGSARRFTPGDLKNPLPGREGMVARALKANAPTLVHKPVEDPELRRLVAMHNCAAAYCLPLRTGRQLHGALLYGHPNPDYFNEARREVLEMVGRQALVALQNAVLYRELQQDRQRMAEIQEEANKKLARDLHDGPTQSVAAIAMRINFARRLIERDIKAAADEMFKIEDLARRTTKEIRHMLFTLRPLVLESSGLVAALQAMAEKMKETYEQNVLIEADAGLADELEMGKQGILFYIAEEAVNNARKHAEAAHIWVRLRRVEPGIALLEVQDDGVGFNVGAVDTNYAARGSLGMVNLRERTEMLSGRMKLESKEGQGTRVRVWAPLNEEAAARLRHGA